MGNWLMSKKENDKWADKANTIAEHKYQCKHCGRKEIIGAYKDRALCSYCHHFIYKTEELEKKYNFREKMMREIRRNK